MSDLARLLVYLVTFMYVVLKAVLAITLGLGALQSKELMSTMI